jgi:CspA family cold shock protein
MAWPSLGRAAQPPCWAKRHSTRISPNRTASFCVPLAPTGPVWRHRKVKRQFAERLPDQPGHHLPTDRRTGSCNCRRFRLTASLFARTQNPSAPNHADAWPRNAIQLLFGLSLMPPLGSATKANQRRTARPAPLTSEKASHVMRISGTVKFFNSAKGFGFITPDEGGKDVFVHATAVEAAGMRALSEGDRVSFEVEDDRRGRGKQAAQLKPA